MKRIPEKKVEYPLVDYEDLALTVAYNIICYTPVNDYTKYHMQETIENIYFHMKTTPRPNIQTRGMATEFDLVTYISNLDSHINVIGVVYLNFEDKFEYKLRDKRIWNTTSLYVESETYQNGPHVQDPYYTSGFAGLQFYLNLNFLKTYYINISMTKFFGKAQFMPFPYPEYSKTTPYRYLLPIISAFSVIVGSLIILGPLMLTLIDEKNKGIHEMMRLAGLPEKFIWITWYMCTLIPGIVVFSSFTLLFEYDYRGSNYAVIRYIEPSLLWAIMVLYFIAQLAFCLFFCALFHKKILGLTSFCVTSVLLGYGAVKVYNYHNMVLVHLSCLSPVGALIQGFQRITYYEVLDLQVSWGYLFFNELTAADASLGFVILMLIFDTGIYLFLTYYLNSIYSGRYGLQKSPLFLFKKNYPENVASNEDIEIEENPFVQPAPENAEISIKAENLSKKYGPIEAVKKINFSTFKDEIFVIVGHSNAGKTTVLSLLSGLLEPTEGSILYKGKIDLTRNIKEFRGILGFCPQMDRLFSYFTIMDHLLFYGTLKGGNKKAAVTEGSNYLQLMGVYENADDVVAVVSTEMKRKLSLCIALMGHSEILVLDEPTTGLDVITKKIIWNVLKKFKEDRTIIITTPSIQEAKLIGDRIAVMNNGVLVCNGSLQFLQMKFATGYDVRIQKENIDLPVTGKKDPTELVIELIRRTIPGSKIINETNAEVLLNLPADTSKFPMLFKMLEERRTAFNIDSIGVSFTTLEKVYAKIGGDSIYGIDGKPIKLSEYVEGELKSRESIFQDIQSLSRLSGYPLLVEQHKALFRKKNIFTYRTWITILYRVVIPTILMAILIWGTVRFDIGDPPLLLSLKLYPNSLILTIKNKYHNPGFYSDLIIYLERNNIKYTIEKDVIPVDALLQYGRNNINSYRRDLLLAIDAVENPRNHVLYVTLYYNRFPSHALPIAIDTFYNAFMKSSLKNISLEMKTYNHPIKIFNATREQDRFNTDVSDTSPIITVWYILIAFFTIDLLDFIAASAIAERTDGFKRIQFLTTVSPLTYWINTFLFDFVFFFIIMFLRLALFKTFDQYGFFAFQYDFLIIITVIFLFMMSGLLFMYLLSFILNARSGTYAYFILFNILCTISTFTFYKFQTSFLRLGPIWSAQDFGLHILKFFLLLVPPFNYSLAFEKYLTGWRVNHLVEAYLEYETSDGKPRTSKYRRTSYLEFASESNPNGILGEIIFLSADVVLFSFLILGIEFGYIDRILNSIFHILGILKHHRINDNSLTTSSKEQIWNRKSYKIEILQRSQSDENHLPYDDEHPIYEILESEVQKNIVKKVTSNILLERAAVKKAIKKLLEKTNVILIAHELRRIYNPLLSIVNRQTNAVQDVTFLMKSGECFGIVGPQEAGKTTTIKMLVGDVTPTRGDAWIKTAKLGPYETDYFAGAGYCAQTDSFLKELTGKEILHVVAALRGIFETDRNDLIQRWVTILGLENVISQVCSTYNDGNKRKMCVALALLGDPDVVFFDEPFHMIDPIARRSLYSLLGQIKSTGQAVVLSSRSIQECETLCDRFMIMIRGYMKFIGSAPELRHEHAQGCYIFIIVKDLETNETEASRADALQQFKFAIEEKFKKGKFTMVEETKTSLLYRIDEAVLWSDVFQTLEDLKKKSTFLQEYQVSEKSLEDVFARLVNEDDQ